MAKTWASYKMRWSDIDMTEYLEMYERIRVHERKQEEAYAKGIFSCKSVEDKETQMENYTYDMKEYVAGEDIGNYRSMTIREGKLYEHNYKEGYNIGFPEVDIKKGTKLKRTEEGVRWFSRVEDQAPETTSVSEESGDLSERDRNDFFQAVKGKKIKKGSSLYMIPTDITPYGIQETINGYCTSACISGGFKDWSFVNDADQKHHENIKRHLIGARLEDKRWTYAQMLERRKQTPEGFAIDFTYPEPELTTKSSSNYHKDVLRYSLGGLGTQTGRFSSANPNISVSPQGAIPVCTCEIRTIMMSGCGCGAFAAEQAAKLTGGNV